MCAPIGLIAGIASAGMSFIGQRQAASAQERAQARATELEQARLRDQLGSARLQQAQANIASAQRIRSASLQAEQARARATVAAGEAGVTGLSVNALVDDMTRREAQFRFYENQRQDMSNTNLALSMEDARMRSRMNLLGINQPINQPNFLQSIVGGFQTGLSLQNQLNRYRFDQGRVASNQAPPQPVGPFNPNYGPFDADGNYIEEMADERFGLTLEPDNSNLS